MNSMRFSIKRNLFSLFLLFFFCMQTSADNLKEHTKIWINAPISGIVSKDKKWNYYVEPQLRLLDDKYKFNQLNLHAGIFYQATSRISLWLVIFRRHDLKSDGSLFRENRLWEQIVWNVIDNDRLKLISRSRLEERKNLDDSQIANRFRQQVALNLPVPTLKNYYLVLADELFFQLNQPTWVTHRVFSQNRATIGIQIPISKQVSYQIGYLNQYQYGNPNQMSNILYFTLSLTMD
jgi:hypothetical protein